MEDVAPTISPATISSLLDVLQGPYTDAVNAHLEYEVFEGVRNKKAIQEFEAALAHLASAIMQDDPAEIPHLRSHCERVAIETTEFVAESYLETIRSRFDPYYRHPHLSRTLFLTKPSFLDETYEELRKMQGLIGSARKLKGKDDTYAECLSQFKDAVEMGKTIDKKTPLCPFGDRLFAVILTIIGIIIGWFVGFVTPRSIFQ